MPSLSVIRGAVSVAGRAVSAILRSAGPACGEGLRYCRGSLISQWASGHGGGARCDGVGWWQSPSSHGRRCVRRWRTKPSAPPCQIVPHVDLTAIARDRVNTGDILPVQPAGQHWQGTVDMVEHETGDYGDCSKSQKGQVDFVVDNTGQVLGTATGDYMNNENGCGNPKASFSGSGPWHGVIGRRTGQEFQLTIYSPACGRGPRDAGHRADRGEDRFGTRNRPSTVVR